MGRRQVTENSHVGRSETAPAAGAAGETIRAGLTSALGHQLGKLCAAPLEAGLYLVSTPVGNLGDISIRALATLALSDMVVCEDTRHSRKLFAAYGIQRKLETYHDFSGETDRARILSALRQGRSVALIADAGTPLIADPGFKLVRAAAAEGFTVVPVPGACAILTGLVASGLPTDQFFFGGFVPPKEKARKDALEAMGSIPGTLVVYETPARIEATLEALQAIFPDRSIALARELTKLHETFSRGSAGSLLEEVRKTPPRGELVLLIAPGEKVQAKDSEVEEELLKAMAAGSLKEAVEEVAKKLGVGKRQVYNLALKIRNRQP